MTKRMIIMLIIVGVIFGVIFGFKGFQSYMMKKYMSSAPLRQSRCRQSLPLLRNGSRKFSGGQLEGSTWRRDS